MAYFIAASSRTGLLGKKMTCKPCPNVVNAGQGYAVFVDARFVWLVDQLLVLKRRGCAKIFVAFGSRLTVEDVPHLGNKM